MGMDFRALVVDLDGTLMGPDSAISRRNRQAIQRARQAGLEVIVATGRTPSESTHAVEAIQHNDLIIGAGGALLSNGEGQTLERFVLSPAEVRCISEPLIQACHKVLILKDKAAVGYDYLAVGEAPLDPVTEWWFDHLPTTCEHVTSLDDDPHQGDSIRVGAISANTNLVGVVDGLRRHYSDEFEILFWSAVTPEVDQKGLGEGQGSTQLLEVFSKGVTKWRMLEHVMLRRSWNRSQIAAIGDGLNDIELLKNAGLGVAMGNAEQHVQAASDYVTASCDADGVAQAIDLILEEKLTSPSA